MRLCRANTLCMTDSNEQMSVTDAQQPVADNSDLNAQFELLKAKNTELIGEKRKVSSKVEELQKQIADMQAATTQQKQAALVEQGEYKSLWQQATETNNSLQQQLSDLQSALEQKDAAFHEQRLRAQAISAFQQAGVLDPDDMYELEKSKLRMSESGSVVAIHGGVEADINAYLGELKQAGSKRAYMFRGNAAVGMGASGNSLSPTNGAGNPYITRNFSEICRLEVEDPALAARLKAQAQGQ
jgi:hypothetical protein